MKETNLTKSYIKEAMLELLAKTSVDNISITDLVKRAGVSRTAFYRNYSSKDELIEDLVIEFLEAISIKNPKDIMKYSIEDFENIFSSIRKEKKEVSLITRASLENIGIINHNNIFSKEMDKRNVESYKDAAIRGSLNYIITKWILSDMKESDKEMATITYNIFHE